MMFVARRVFKRLGILGYALKSRSSAHRNGTERLDANPIIQPKILSLSLYAVIEVPIVKIITVLNK